MNAFQGIGFDDLDGFDDSLKDVLVDKTVKSQLLAEISNGNTLKAQEFLDQLFTIDQEIVAKIFEENLTALLEAALIKFPDDVLKCCELIFTTLSSEKKKSDISQILIAGQNLRPSLLHLAIQNNLQEVVRALVDAGVPLEEKDENLQTPLIIACGCGHKELVEFLLGRGADGTCDNYLGLNAFLIACASEDKELVACFLKFEDSNPMWLYHAVVHGMSEIVGALLEKGVDTTVLTPEGQSILGVVLEKGSRDVLLKFIEKGIVSSYRNDNGDNGDNVFHRVARLGRWDIVDTLALFDEASIDVKNMRGETPVFIGVMKGNVKFVEKLLAYSVDVQRKYFDENTLLHIAARYANREMIELLIEHGLILESKNSKGYNPFHIACMAGNKEIVQFYIEKGIDLTGGDIKGMPPLHLAAKNGRTEVVELLISAEAQIEIKNKKSQSPLLIACLKGHVETARVFIKYNANIEALDKNGDTALYLAAREGHNDIVDLLLESGASVAFANTEKCLPLHSACFNGREYIVDKLLKHGGFDINAVDVHGDTPLHDAVVNGNKVVVRHLLSFFADANIANKKGQTPLHLACEKGHSTIALMLLNHGVDIHTKDNKGHTPLYCAEASRMPHVVKFFVTQFEKPCGFTFDPSTQKLSQLIEILKKDAQNVIERMEKGRHNPLGLPLVLQSRSLAKCFIRLMSISDACKYLSKLIELQPRALDFIIDLFMSIHPSHFHMGNVKYAKLPQAPSEITIKDYEKIVDELNFIDPSKDDYINPSSIVIGGKAQTPKDLKEGVEKFIKEVSDRHVYGMRSTKNTTQEDYYAQIECALKHVLKKVQSSDPATKHVKLFHIATELSSASGLCSAPYLQVPMDLFRIYCLESKLSFEDELYHNLRLRREFVLESMCQESYVEPSQSVHALEYFKRHLGKKIGLLFAKEGYKDDFALSGFTTDKFPKQKTIEKSFKKYYSPSLILGTILNMLSEHENQSTYRAWAEKGLKGLLEEGDELALEEMRKKAKEAESKVIHYSMKKKKVASCYDDELRKFDEHIVDDTKVLISFEKELESLQGILKVDDADEVLLESKITEAEVVLYALERQSEEVPEEFAEYISEQKRTLRALIFNRIEKVENKIALLSLKKVKMPESNLDGKENFDELLQELASKLLDLEKKLEPLGGRSLLQRQLVKSSEEDDTVRKIKQTVCKIAEHHLKKLKKIQENKTHDDLIDKHTNQLLELEKELEKLGGMQSMGTGLSVSIKDEKSGRVSDKLFSLEDQRPVLQYLLMALEKLCVLRL